MNISKETIKIIENHRLPYYSEIPNVGLYLEQTSKYINEYLEPIMDTAITGSMISNYVKKKMLPNPVKKMYYREHIAQLIIIAVIKSVLSMDKIKLIMDMDSDITPEASYMRFSGEFEYALKNTFGIAAKHPAKTAENSRANLLGDIVNTAAHKIYIDKMIASLE